MPLHMSCISFVLSRLPRSSFRLGPSSPTAAVCPRSPRPPRGSPPVSREAAAAHAPESPRALRDTVSQATLTPTSHPRTPGAQALNPPVLPAPVCPPLTCSPLPPPLLLTGTPGSRSPRPAGCRARTALPGHSPRPFAADMHEASPSPEPARPARPPPPCPLPPCHLSSSRFVPPRAIRAALTARYPPISSLPPARPRPSLVSVHRFSFLSFLGV